MIGVLDQICNYLHSIQSVCSGDMQECGAAHDRYSKEKRTTDNQGPGERKHLDIRRLSILFFVKEASQI